MVAGVETTTITQVWESGPGYSIIVVGLDENGDFSSTLDIEDYLPKWMPCKFTIDTVQTGGTTAGVTVSIQGSWDGSQWETLATDSDCEDGLYAHGPSVDWGEPDTNHNKAFRYYRILCSIVGAGNTLTASAYLYNPYKG